VADLAGRTQGLEGLRQSAAQLRERFGACVGPGLDLQGSELQVGSGPGGFRSFENGGFAPGVPRGAGIRAI
jgi:hypothetical protein